MEDPASTSTAPEPAPAPASPPPKSGPSAPAVPLDPSAGPAWHRISRPSNAPGVETLYLMLHGGAYEMKRGASIERPFHLPQEARTLLSLERDGYTLTPIPAPAAEEAK